MSDAGPLGSVRRFRAWGFALVLLGLLVMQVEMTARWWTRPFLDGALHYDFDNAEFSWKARNGILLGEARTQLGVTEVPSIAWGTPSGPPRFYTHHPFLIRVAFQLVVRAFGDAEWVSRVFALLVSATAVAGTVTALYLAGGSLIAAALGGLVLVNVPLFATYQSCIKCELDGLAVGTWFFVAVAWALRDTRPRSAIAVGVLTLLSVLAHWTSMLFAGAVLVWLALEWLPLGHRAARRPAIATFTGLLLGLGVLAAVFAWLAGGWTPLVKDLTAAVHLRTDATTLTSGEWLDRQRLYVSMNFGAILPWLVLALGLWQSALAIRGWSASREAEPSRRLLAAWIGCSLGAALAWQLGFPQGSFVHVFWQIWFLLPIAGLVTAAVVAAPEGLRRRTASVAGVVLVAHLHVASRAAVQNVLALQRGTPEDIRFLVSQRHDRFARFVFVPMHDEPFNQWFTGPIFPYYTDRQVERFTTPADIVPTDRLLVLRHPDQEQLIARLGRYLRRDLVEAGCGPRFCAYDVRR